MISLIKNELTKIFKKKSIFIILLISILFMCFNNVIYKQIDNLFTVESEYSEENIKQTKENLKNFVPVTSDDYEEYSELQSTVDTYELLSKYDKNDWKYHVLLKDVFPYISEYNRYKLIYHDVDMYQEKYKEYTDFVNFINNTNDWKDYARYEIAEQEKEIVKYNELLKTSESEEETLSYNNAIKIADGKIEKLKLRIENNIPYSDDYLNTALEVYDPNVKSYEEFSLEMKENQKNKYDEYETKKEYYTLVTSNAKQKYIFENKKDIESTVTLANSLTNFVGDYGIFILIISISVAGGIVSNEFDKGTIKNLLIRPYKRWKILLSKYIAVLITTLLSIITLLILELIIGGIILGFDSLQNSIIVYSFTKNSILQINAIKYVIDSIISTLPMFILLATLGFTISTIFNSTSLGIALPMLGYFGGNIINLIIESYKIKILHYFVTPNWDLSKFLYGNIGNYLGSSVMKSLLICFIYLIIMIIPAFIVFSKRNVKNI